MRKSKVFINDFSPSQNDSITFDTNVLIKLLYPVDYSGAYEAYSTLYDEILKSKAMLIVSSIQISEFVNRCIRMQFDLYKKENNDLELDFKSDYRNTNDYNESMNAILDIVRYDILKNFTVLDDGFSKMNLDKLFLYGFSYDFNDAFLVEFAKINNAILVTHDSDFGNFNTKVKMVTANRKLLLFS